MSRRRASTGSLTPEAVRNRFLEKAGVSEEDRIRLLKAAITAEESALDANKTVVVSDKGIVTDTHHEPDWAVRLRAAHQLKTMLNAYPSRSEGSTNAPQVIVQVKMPDYTKPRAIPNTVITLPQADVKELEDNREVRADGE